MKVAVVDGEIICAEVGSYYEQLRATGRFKWNRADKTMRGAMGLISLNALADCCKLPPKLAEERERLQELTDAIEVQRRAKNPVPLVPFPVRAELMAHQIRGANMALLYFGAVTERKENPA